MKPRSIFTPILALLVIGAFASVNADQWRLPKKRIYFAPTMKYYFEVTPRKLESQLQYFEEKDEGRDVSGTIGNQAKGAFYARRTDGGGYSKKWEFPLLNEVSPVSALVSGDGSYVVTFDNWHSAGYGNDVVVIYRANGDLVKNFGLEDLLTEGDISTLYTTVSSIWWGGQHYIDDKNGTLILKVVSNGKSPVEKSAKYHELKIDLSTGQPLEPKRDLLPQLQFTTGVDAEAACTPSDAFPHKPICVSAEENFDSPEFVRISSEQVFMKAKERTFPTYPLIAKLAHAQGRVVVEMLISKTGDVICARALSGHPLLNVAALSAALKWKFEPFEVSGKPANVVATIAMNFKKQTVYPNKQLRK